MKPKVKPDAERVRQLFNYDPLTGVFTWRNNAGRWGKIPAGTVAGSANGDGYLYVRVDGYSVQLALLAWLYVHGEWPDLIVDHRNTTKTDNRIENLRLADYGQSNRNRGVHKSNACGLKGVSKRGKVWRSVVYFNNETYQLGYFGSKEEAHAAYLEKARELHGEFAHA
jgi:hypothetical protein